MPTCIYRDPRADCTSKNSSSAHEELSESISETRWKGKSRVAVLIPPPVLHPALPSEP